MLFKSWLDSHCVQLLETIFALLCERFDQITVSGLMLKTMFNQKIFSILFCSQCDHFWYYHRWSLIRRISIFWFPKYDILSLFRLHLSLLKVIHAFFNFFEIYNVFSFSSLLGNDPIHLSHRYDRFYPLRYFLLHFEKCCAKSIWRTIEESK